MSIKRFNLGLFVALAFIGGVFACGEEDTTPDSNTEVNTPDPLYARCVWGWAGHL